MRNRSESCTVVAALVVAMQPQNALYSPSVIPQILTDIAIATTAVALLLSHLICPLVKSL